MKRMIKQAALFRDLMTLALVLLWSGPGFAESEGDLEILLFGDSLAAGYGLSAEDGLTAQLQARLNSEGVQALVKNGGVSGDTTAGGLSRLDWALSAGTDVVILVLGGNDAMRGLTPSQSQSNLDALLAKLATREVKILLTGMRAPPNLGPDYAAAFEPMYQALAKKHDVALYPFILEGVAADPALNQGDGIHPNAAGVEVIVDGLTPLLLPLLQN